MEIVLQKHLINILASFVIGFTFLSVPMIITQNEAHAACDDTARPGVDWHNCRKRNLIMDGFNFAGSDFTRTDLSASDLRNSNFTDAIFYKTNLVRASLAGSQAKNTNFQSVIASRTDFSRGNFEGANFQKAEISRSNFSNSNLKNANMSKGDFSRVNFFNANLDGVNFKFSNLSRANLTETAFSNIISLKGAYTYLTKIEGLDLSNLNDLEQWQIDMACGNSKTILPTGFAQPKTWPCNSDANE